MFPVITVYFHDNSGSYKEIIGKLILIILHLITFFQKKSYGGGDFLENRIFSRNLQAYLWYSVLRVNKFDKGGDIFILY